MHPCKQTCTNNKHRIDNIHYYIDTYMHTYIHTHRHTYIHTYNIQTYIHTYRLTYVQTYLHTYTHTYIHTDRQTDRQTHLHTYIHPSIHPSIHTYIHTRTYYQQNFCFSPACIDRCLTNALTDAAERLPDTRSRDMPTREQILGFKWHAQEKGTSSCICEVLELVKKLFAVRCFAMSMTLLVLGHIRYVSEIHQTLQTDGENPSPMPCPNDRSKM